MLPFRLVYHERYDLRLGEHVFPSQKYRLIRERMIEEGFAGPEDFVSPEPATDDDLRLAHDAEWIARLRDGTLSYAELMQLEIPFVPQTRDAFWCATGGTKLATRLALEQRIGFNLSGGFHHAFAAHGEGFCPINDVAVAIRCLQRDALIQTAMVVDCDVHHGNGTAAIFARDATVFTLSIHQLNNYPVDKPPSNIDIHLRDGTADEEYLSRLNAGLASALAEFHPDLIVYVAGADPYEQDQLGGLALTMAGLQRRDRLVLGEALRRSIPAAVVLAGGYAVDVRDTVSIHVNTAKAARDLLLPPQA